MRMSSSAGSVTMEVTSFIPRPYLSSWMMAQNFSWINSAMFVTVELSAKTKAPSAWGKFNWFTNV